MKTLLISVLVATPLTLGAGTGCKNKDKKDKKDNDDKAAGVTLTLDKVDGLKVTAPKGSTVSGGIGGGNMVQGPGLVISVDKATGKPADPSAAKKEAEMFTPQNWKEEKLADGWLVTFENKGSMGTNYWLQVRREIGGTAYWCSTTSVQAKQRSSAIAACKSLAK